MNTIGGNCDHQRIRKEASIWIDCLESGTSAEKTEFVAWIRRHPLHSWEFLELAGLDEQIRRCDPGQEFDVEDLLRRASTVVSPLNRQGVGTSGNSGSLSQTASLRSKEHGRKSAPYLQHAVICFLALLAMIWACDSSVEQYNTRPGEYRLVQLNDGSRMHLNSATRAQVRFNESGRHIDLLQGEALFDVAHEAGRPFLVTGAGVTAQALGTRFDVKVTMEDFQLTVDRGRVAITSKAETDQLAHAVLSGGQMARVTGALNARSIHVRTLSRDETQQAVLWTGSLMLSGMPLREAVARFNASNTTQILIDDPSIGDFHLGGQFALLEPEVFVQGLEALGTVVAIRPLDQPSTIRLVGTKGNGIQD